MRPQGFDSRGGRGAVGGGNGKQIASEEKSSKGGGAAAAATTGTISIQRFSRYCTVHKQVEEDCHTFGFGVPQDDGVAVYIEHCIDCESHAAFSHHKTEKYEGAVELIRFFLKEFDATAQVVANPNPSHYGGCEGSVPLDSSSYPRIGSFEVFLSYSRTQQPLLLYSKLQKGRFPKMEVLRKDLAAKLIQEPHPTRPMPPKVPKLALDQLNSRPRPPPSSSSASKPAQPLIKPPNKSKIETNEEKMGAAGEEKRMIDVAAAAVKSTASYNNSNYNHQMDDETNDDDHDFMGFVTSVQPPATTSAEDYKVQISKVDRILKDLALETWITSKDDSASPLPLPMRFLCLLRAVGVIDSSFLSGENNKSNNGLASPSSSSSSLPLRELYILMCGNSEEGGEERRMFADCVIPALKILCRPLRVRVVLLDAHDDRNLENGEEEEQQLGHFTNDSLFSTLFPKENNKDNSTAVNSARTSSLLDRFGRRLTAEETAAVTRRQSAILSMAARSGGNRIAGEMAGSRIFPMVLLGRRGGRRVNKETVAGSKLSNFMDGSQRAEDSEAVWTVPLIETAMITQAATSSNGEDENGMVRQKQKANFKALSQFLAPAVIPVGACLLVRGERARVETDFVHRASPDVVDFIAAQSDEEEQAILEKMATFAESIQMEADYLFGEERIMPFDADSVIGGGALSVIAPSTFNHQSQVAVAVAGGGGNGRNTSSSQKITKIEYGCSFFDYDSLAVEKETKRRAKSLSSSPSSFLTTAEKTTIGSRARGFLKLSEQSFRHLLGAVERCCSGIQETSENTSSSAKIASETTASSIAKLFPVDVNWEASLRTLLQLRKPLGSSGNNNRNIVTLTGRLGAGLSTFVAMLEARLQTCEDGGSVFSFFSREQDSSNSSLESILAHLIKQMESGFKTSAEQSTATTTTTARTAASVRDALLTAQPLQDARGEDSKSRLIRKFIQCLERRTAPVSILIDGMDGASCRELTSLLGSLNTAEATPPVFAYIVRRSENNSMDDAASFAFKIPEISDVGCASIFNFWFGQCFETLSGSASCLDSSRSLQSSPILRSETKNSGLDVRSWFPQRLSSVAEWGCPLFCAVAGHTVATLLQYAFPVGANPSAASFANAESLERIASLISSRCGCVDGPEGLVESILFPLLERKLGVFAVQSVASAIATVTLWSQEGIIRSNGFASLGDIIDISQIIAARTAAKDPRRIGSGVVCEILAALGPLVHVEEEQGEGRVFIASRSLIQAVKSRYISDKKDSESSLRRRVSSGDLLNSLNMHCRKRADISGQGVYWDGNPSAIVSYAMLSIRTGDFANALRASNLFAIHRMLREFGVDCVLSVLDRIHRELRMKVEGPEKKQQHEDQSEEQNIASLSFPSMLTLRFSLRGTKPDSIPLSSILYLVHNTATSSSSPQETLDHLGEKVIESLASFLHQSENFASLVDKDFGRFFRLLDANFSSQSQEEIVVHIGICPSARQENVAAHRKFAQDICSHISELWFKIDDDSIMHSSPLFHHRLAAVTSVHFAAAADSVVKNRQARLTKQQQKEQQQKQEESEEKDNSEFFQAALKGAAARRSFVSLHSQILQEQPDRIWTLAIASQDELIRDEVRGLMSDAVHLISSAESVQKATQSIETVLNLMELAKLEMQLSHFLLVRFDTCLPSPEDIRLAQTLERIRIQLSDVLDRSPSKKSERM